MSNNSTISKKQRRARNKATIYTAIDLLNPFYQIALRFHHYCKAVGKTSGDNNTRLLSYYLGQHHMRFVSKLNLYGTAGSLKNRNREILKNMNILPDQGLDLLNKPPNRIKGRDLLKAAIAFSGSLTAACEALLAGNLRTEDAMLLQNIYEFEKNESGSFGEMLKMNYFL